MSPKALLRPVAVRIVDRDYESIGEKLRKGIYTGFCGYKRSWFLTALKKPKSANRLSSTFGKGTELVRRTYRSNEALNRVSIRWLCMAIVNGLSQRM